jgi:hypothetical protein
LTNRFIAEASRIRRAFFHRVVAGIHPVRQQQINFGTQVSVAGAGRIQKLSLSSGVELECFS